MNTFLHAVSSVSLILLLTATGYISAAKGWFNAETKAFVSKFLMTVAIPFMCVYSITQNLTFAMLKEAGAILLVPFICSILNMLLAFIIARIIHIPHRRMGVFIVMCSLSNALFIGYAMCSELFGESCTPYVMLFYIVNTSFTQFVGLPLIRWTGEAKNSERTRVNPVLRFLTTPTVYSVLLAIFIVLLDIPLPSLLVSYAKYLNNLVTPLALLLTGYIIHSVGLRNIRLDLQQGIVVLFRFVVSPGFALFLCAAFGVSGLGRSVLVVEAAMPVLTQTVVAATEYQADEAFAAQGAAISTIGCFVATPLLMMLL